ncbi:MAG: c-type cytochrome [Sphingomicrobium sp.]
MVGSRVVLAAALVSACTVQDGGPVIAAAAAPVIVPAPAPGPTVAELVQARQAGMHTAATLNAKGIGPRAKGEGDLRDTPWSDGIEMWAAAIPGLFPPGSAHPQSRAKPEIWANKADFDAKARDLGEAAHAVTVAGQAGDLKAYAAAAQRLNTACSACHMAYRGPPLP